MERLMQTGKLNNFQQLFIQKHNLFAKGMERSFEANNSKITAKLFTQLFTT
jgi:hypothetical protein